MPPHIRKRGRVYYLIDGRYAKSLHTSKKGDAETLLRAHILKKLGIPHAPPRPLSDFIKPYTEYCRLFNRASTLEDKERVLRFFKEYAGDPLIGQVRDATVLGFLVARKDQGISSERWNSERQILQNFFNYLIRQEQILERNPAAGVRRQKVVRRKVPRALTGDEEAILLNYLSKDPALCDMAIFVGNTGIRVRELAYLTWGDVDLDHELLYIRGKDGWAPKGYEERAIPLNSTALQALRRQKLRSLKAPWIFPKDGAERYGRGLDMKMVRAFKKAKIGSGGFHVLRHTYATRMTENGCPPETLRRLMGHADLRTMQKYLHVSEEHLRSRQDMIDFGKCRTFDVPNLGTRGNKSSQQKDIC